MKYVTEFDLNKCGWPVALIYVEFYFPTFRKCFTIERVAIGWGGFFVDLLYFICCLIYFVH